MHVPIARWLPQQRPQLCATRAACGLDPATEGPDLLSARSALLRRRVLNLLRLNSIPDPPRQNQSFPLFPSNSLARRLTSRRLDFPVVLGAPMTNPPPLDLGTKMTPPPDAKTMKKKLLMNLQKLSLTPLLTPLLKLN